MTTRDELIAALLAECDPGMKQMESARRPQGTQDQWATKDDHYRFGWNACRAEILNRLEASKALQQAQSGGEVTEEKVEIACEAYVKSRVPCEAPFSEWVEDDFKNEIRKGIRTALSASLNTPEDDRLGNLIIYADAFLAGESTKEQFAEDVDRIRNLTAASESNRITESKGE